MSRSSHLSRTTKLHPPNKTTVTTGDLPFIQNKLLTIPTKAALVRQIGGMKRKESSSDTTNTKSTTSLLYPVERQVNLSPDDDDDKPNIAQVLEEATQVAGIVGTTRPTKKPRCEPRLASSPQPKHRAGRYQRRNSFVDRGRTLSGALLGLNGMKRFVSCQGALERCTVEPVVSTQQNASWDLSSLAISKTEKK